MVYLFALLSILLGTFAQLLLKLSVQEPPTAMSFHTIIRILCNWHFMAGALCYGLSLLFWIKVLSELELSKAYPLVSLGYVFAFILGCVFLGEAVRPMRVLGVAIIIIGVIIISRS